MTIWSKEIKELRLLFESLQNQRPKLVKEMEQLVKTDDANVVLLYSRRCLEVIITELCEKELNRPRGTEPLKGIIDKLNKEEKVPSNIITSMLHLNSLATFGAHPKEYDLEQVKPVLNNLTTIIKWYNKYQTTYNKAEEANPENQKKLDATISTRKSKKKLIIAFSVLFLLAVVIVFVVLNLTGNLKQLETGNIQSLVILPFDNFTGSDESDYYVAGIHSSLITDLGQISALRVPGKTTSNSFKNTDMSVQQITSTLNVDAALEGSVSYFGEDTVIVQIRLISTLTEEKQLWVQDFRLPKSQILNFYNDVTKEISKEINIRLTPNEESLLAETRTLDPEAYDAYLKGLYYWEKLHRDSIQLAMQCFELAVQKEPEWADPYVGLANTWLLFSNKGILPESITVPNMVRNLEKAMELNPQSSQAHYGNAIYAVWTNWDWEHGEKEFLKTIEINPNDALARLYYAHLLIILHRYDEAVHEADIGLALDPLRPLVLMLYSMVMTAIGDYQTAITTFEKNRELGSSLASKGGALEALFLTGDYERWIQNWEKKVRLFGWNDTAIENVVSTFYKKGHIAAIEEMFKMNKMYGNGPGGALMTSNLKARRSLYLNKPEDALDYLEKQVDSKRNGLDNSYIGAYTYTYEKLKTYPRYVELLRKMNLPLPDIED